jgi:hypothetical protein
MAEVAPLPCPLPAVPLAPVEQLDLSTVGPIHGSGGTMQRPPVVTVLPVAESASTATTEDLPWKTPLDKACITEPCCCVLACVLPSVSHCLLQSRVGASGAVVGCFTEFICAFLPFGGGHSAKMLQKHHTALHVLSGRPGIMTRAE